MPLERCCGASVSRGLPDCPQKSPHELGACNPPRLVLTCDMALCLPSTRHSNLSENVLSIHMIHGSDPQQHFSGSQVLSAEAFCGDCLSKGLLSPQDDQCCLQRDCHKERSGSLGKGNPWLSTHPPSAITRWSQYHAFYVGHKVLDSGMPL